MTMARSSSYMGKYQGSLLDCEVLKATEDMLEFELDSEVNSARDYGDDGRPFNSGMHDDDICYPANVKYVRTRLGIRAECV